MGKPSASRVKFRREHKVRKQKKKAKLKKIKQDQKKRKISFPTTQNDDTIDQRHFNHNPNDRRNIIPIQTFEQKMEHKSFRKRQSDDSIPPHLRIKELLKKSRKKSKKAKQIQRKKQKSAKSHHSKQRLQSFLNNNDSDGDDDANIDDIDSVDSEPPQPQQTSSSKANKTDDNSDNAQKSKKKNKKVKNWDELSSRLEDAQFRWMNELLYNSNSKDAYKQVCTHGNEFETYHRAYNRILENNWPESPLTKITKKIVKWILDKNRRHIVIADFGCGDAKLAQFFMDGDPRWKTRNIEVHSFDLFALNKYVTQCDMSNTDLKDGSVDIAVFCLSLMGTNFHTFLMEAYRVLLPNGQLKIAEVRSRIVNLNSLRRLLETLGFDIRKVNSENTHFTLIDCVKSVNRDPRDLSYDFDCTRILRPCSYKKR